MRVDWISIVLFNGTQSRNDATEESCRRIIGLHLNIVKRSRENVKMMSIKSEVNSVCCKLGHLSLLFTRAPDWLFTIFPDTIEHVRVICIGTLGLHAALRSTALACFYYLSDANFKASSIDI